MNETIKKILPLVGMGLTVAGSIVASIANKETMKTTIAKEVADQLSNK